MSRRLSRQTAGLWLPRMQLANLKLHTISALNGRARPCGPSGLKNMPFESPIPGCSSNQPLVMVSIASFAGRIGPWHIPCKRSAACRSGRVASAWPPFCVRAGLDKLHGAPRGNWMRRLILTVRVCPAGHLRESALAKRRRRSRRANPGAAPLRPRRGISGGCRLHH